MQIINSLTTSKVSNLYYTFYVQIMIELGITKYYFSNILLVDKCLLTYLLYLRLRHKQWISPILTI